MSVQYITDSEGNPTGVFIPIKDWDHLKQTFEGIEEAVSIPEWHKEIVLERMKESEKKPDRLLDWEQEKNQFTLD